MTEWRTLYQNVNQAFHWCRWLIKSFGTVSSPKIRFQFDCSKKKKKNLDCLTQMFFLISSQTSELGVTEHVEGDPCKFALWVGRTPTSDNKIVLKVKNTSSHILLLRYALGLDWYRFSMAGLYTYWWIKVLELKMEHWKFRTGTWPDLGGGGGGVSVLASQSLYQSSPVFSLLILPSLCCLVWLHEQLQSGPERLSVFPKSPSVSLWFLPLSSRLSLWQLVSPGQILLSSIC